LSAKALEAETIKQKKQKSEYSFQDPKTAILSDSAKAQLNDSIKEKTRILYQKNWQKYVDWLRPSTVPAGITDTSVMNFVSHLSKTMVPSGLRSVLSALKHQALELFNIDLNAGSFCKVNQLLAAIEKASEHVPRAAKAFTEEQLSTAFTLFSDDGADLVHKIVGIIGSRSLGRISDYKSIACEDVHDNELRERFEIVIHKPVKQRGSKRHRDFEFFVTGNEERRLLKLYVSKIQAYEGQFIKNFNVKSGHYVQNMGIHGLNEIPKIFATRLNLPNPEKFSGQSWRRTGATIATNNGLSAPQLQAAGRWASNTAPNLYIEKSDVSRLQVAKTMELKLMPVDSTSPVQTSFTQDVTAAAPAIESKSSNSAETYKCVMLHEVLANHPDHFLWKSAPEHILKKAVNLMDSRGDFKR